MKKNISVSCTIAFIYLFLFSCTGKDADLKKYYFPYAGFVQPKVYMYENVKNPGDVVYNHIQTSVSGTDTFMTTTTYEIKSDSLNLVQVSVEKIIPTGSELSEVYIFNNTLLNGNIKNKEIFSWKKAANKPWNWSFTYAPDSFTTIEIIKKRIPAGEKEGAGFADIKEKHIVFNDAYLINIQSPNRTKTLEEYTYSCYAEGTGLIAYEVMQPGLANRRYTLKKIMDQKEWEEFYKSAAHPLHLWPILTVDG